MRRANVRPAYKSSIWRKVPGYARAILVAQFAVIVFLATSMYLEYQNNLYLQSYLKTSLQSNMPALLTIIPVTLAAGTITVYAKLLTAGNPVTEDHHKDKAELQPLSMPKPIVFSLDEVMAPKPRDQIPQLRRILSQSRQRKTSRRAVRTSGMTDRQSGQKRTKNPNARP